MTLSIDYYALRSEEHDWLVRFVSDVSASSVPPGILAFVGVAAVNVIGAAVVVSAVPRGRPERSHSLLFFFGGVAPAPTVRMPTQYIKLSPALPPRLQPNLAFSSALAKWLHETREQRAVTETKDAKVSAWSTVL